MEPAIMTSREPPRHGAADDEGEERQAVDRDAEQRLEGVHLVDVHHAGERKRRQHHDAHPAAEVSAVDRQDELQDDRRAIMRSARSRQRRRQGPAGHGAGVRRK